MVEVTDSSSHVVVVDDEAGIRESLKKILEREGHQVTITDSGEEALELVRNGSVDLILADIMMPKMNGIDLLRAVKAIAPATEMMMMTAFGTVENAVECMREGAYDFISKPLKRAIVVRSVQRALERKLLLSENQRLRETLTETGGQDIVGQSPAMRSCLALVSQAAPSEATILLIGESGTGKELIARKIHELSGRTGPYVAVNCAALPENLLESELFGHERGAFTGATERKHGRFERAGGGTLLLDEIGETSAALQVRLLRVLQEGEIERVGGSATVPVNVRVLAATNRDLEELVANDQFREDLFYRLNVIQVKVPPLRQRHGDVPLLAQHFVQHFAAKNRKGVKGFSEAALKCLDAYEWPGNVRELENTIERAVVLTRSDVIGANDLPDAIRGAERKREPTDAISIPFGTPLEEVERRLIHETLERVGGDKKTAANILGIATRTIYRKLSDD
ncbi:MAG: sigma-54 dependent transcriptional regulator [Myxococcota bacterium]